MQEKTLDNDRISGHFEKFSDRLEFLMERDGYSQSELARRMGTRQSTVGGWLNDAIPRKKTLTELATLFNVLVPWLAKGAGNMLVTDDLINEEVTPDLDTETRDPPFGAEPLPEVFENKIRTRTAQKKSEDLIDFLYDNIEAAIVENKTPSRVNLIYLEELAERTRSGSAFTPPADELDENSESLEKQQPSARFAKLDEANKAHAKKLGQSLTVIPQKAAPPIFDEERDGPFDEFRVAEEGTDHNRPGTEEAEEGQEEDLKEAPLDRLENQLPEP